MTKELNIVSTHPGPVAVVTWDIPPALERLYEAQEAGREAFRRGETPHYDWDKEFEPLLTAPNLRPSKEALVCAWRYGWHLARLQSIQPPPLPDFPGDPLSIDIETGRAVVVIDEEIVLQQNCGPGCNCEYCAPLAWNHAPRRCCCPPGHYHGETTWSCCNECGLPVHPEKTAKLYENGNFNKPRKRQ